MLRWYNCCFLTITTTTTTTTTINTTCYYSSIYGHTYSKSMDQPGKVANPAPRSWSAEQGKLMFSSPRTYYAPDNLVSRDGLVRQPRSA